MRELTNEETKELQTLMFKLMCTFKEICDKEGIWYTLAFGTLLGAIRHDGFIPWDVDADVFIKITDKEKFRKAFENNKPEGMVLRNYNKDKRYLKSHDQLCFEGEQKYYNIHVDIYPLIGAPSDEKEQNHYMKESFYLDKIFRSKYVDIRECKPKNKPLVLIAKILDFFIPDSLIRKNILKRESRYDFEKAEFWTSLVNYGDARSCMPKRIWENTEDHVFEGVQFKIPTGWDEYLTRCYGDYMTPKKY